MVIKGLKNILLFSWLCYPILAAWYTIFGMIWYNHLFFNPFKHLFKVKDQPFVSIVISAHNEHSTLRRTVTYLATKLYYSNYEILIANDGSTDDTLEIARELKHKYHNIRIINIQKNNGKAHALNVAIGFAKGDFILVNDADVWPERYALQKYMNYFKGQQFQNVGAVTANMNVYNRSSAIDKSEVVEFTSIISGLKKTQAALTNNMYAVSGANTVFRKTALIDVGGFRQNRSTEDISITWDMGLYDWGTCFAPNILCHMSVPSTAYALYKQRKRWSQGGTEVWLSNFGRLILYAKDMYKRIPIYFDTTLSISWGFLYFSSFIYTMGLSIFYAVSGNFLALWNFWSIIMSLMCIEYIVGMLQLGIAFYYDRNHNKMNYLCFAPLYVNTMWMIGPLSIITTFYGAIKTVFGKVHSMTWASSRNNK